MKERLITIKAHRDEKTARTHLVLSTTLAALTGLVLGPFSIIHVVGLFGHTIQYMDGVWITILLSIIKSGNSWRRVTFAGSS